MVLTKKAVVKMESSGKAHSVEYWFVGSSDELNSAVRKKILGQIEDDSIVGMKYDRNPDEDTSMLVITTYTEGKTEVPKNLIKEVKI